MLHTKQKENTERICSNPDCNELGVYPSAMAGDLRLNTDPFVDAIANSNNQGKVLKNVKPFSFTKRNSCPGHYITDMQLLGNITPEARDRLRLFTGSSFKSVVFIWHIPFFPFFL
mgnify:CR=1 FL=1